MSQKGFLYIIISAEHTIKDLILSLYANVKHREKITKNKKRRKEAEKD